MPNSHFAKTSKGRVSLSQAITIFAATWFVLAPAVTSASDWPQFRGPAGQGHSIEKGLPVTWSESENIAWRTEIPGLGWSSPVVGGDQIWLTTAIEQEGSLRAVALDKNTGDVLGDIEVFRKADLGRINSKNSHASPTPVLDGQYVFVHYGAHGTACLTTDGQIIWKRVLEHNHHHGPGGSPIVWGDLLIVNCDGMDRQFVIALNKHNGKTVWEKDREGKASFSTPLVVDFGSGPQLISNGGDGVYAYNPADGTEIWHCKYEGHSVIPRPVAGRGLVHICSGYWTPTLYTIRTDGRGDVTTSHVVHRYRRGVPYTPSPLLFGDWLLMISDRGIATCLEASTGKEVWHERVPGDYSASPIYADGRIYLLNEEGATTVLAAGPQFIRHSVNKLPGQTLATPAIADGAIFLRTDTALFCIKGSGASQSQLAPSPERSGVVPVRAELKLP